MSGAGDASTPTAQGFVDAVRACGFIITLEQGQTAADEAGRLDVLKCDACARVWPSSLIDGKAPLNPEPGEEENFTRLEGPCCYGEGWCPT